MMYSVACKIQNCIPYTLSLLSYIFFLLVSDFDFDCLVSVDLVWKEQ